MAHSSRHESEDLDARRTPQIAALSTLKDFEVADETPDPRGWTVFDGTGADVGKVHDLIVDTVAMRTRYLDVGLDKDVARLDDDRHVLIPVGLARLDDDRDCVVLGTLSVTQLADLPPFTHREIDREYERSLLPLFDSERAATASPSTAESTDFYDHRHFDDRHFFGKRRSPVVEDERRVRREEEAAAANRDERAEARTIRRRAEASRTVEPDAAAEGEVTVERIPVRNADSAAGADTTDDEIRIPVYEDEIVVTKRRVLKEEVVLNKREIQESQSREDDKPREKADDADRR